MTELPHPISDEELQKIQLFQMVSLESIKGLLEYCTLRTLEPNEILIESNALNTNIYFILKGRLRVHLDNIENNPVIVLEEGESVGEMSVIDKQPTSAFVIADTACRIMMMDEDILWSLVQSSHAAACNLLFILTNRLRHADVVICKGVELEQLYHRYGTVDALTGLHNRYWLDNKLKRHYHRCIIDRKPMSVIMIDIDHFKQYNDLYGHPLGDRLLYFVAHTISHHLRPSESIARYGGDEFIILLPDVGIDRALKVAERIHESVLNAQFILPDGVEVHPQTISVGVAELQEGQPLEMLISNADAALYRAKEKGKNCVSD